jgi:PAS domain S-box-containing protein
MESGPNAATQASSGFVRVRDDKVPVLFIELREANANGAIEHANDAFLRALGYTRQELAKLTFVDVMEHGFEGVDREIRSAVRERGIWRGTLVRRRHDGSTLPASCTVVGLREPAGSITHYVGVERDRTDELRLRDQLVHSERLSAIGELVVGVAHEINNPLQTIVGSVELIDSGHSIRKPLRRPEKRSRHQIGYRMLLQNPSVTTAADVVRPRERSCCWPRRPPPSLATSFTRRPDRSGREIVPQCGFIGQRLIESPCSPYRSSRRVRRPAVCTRRPRPDPGRCLPSACRPD